MKLAGIPQIIDILKNNNVITADQHQSVVDELKTTRGFAGAIGINKGYYTQETLDKWLTEQSAQKAEAAIVDMQTIKTSGTQQHPPFLTANWGNNGVNPAASVDKLTRVDGASAAANIAQNIVMIVNDHPHLLANQTVSEQLIAAVTAAANLARGITNGPSERVPLDKKSSEWINSAVDGLRTAVVHSPHIPQDKSQKPINLEHLIEERSKEIGRGIQLSMTQHVAQSSTQARHQ